MASAFWKILPYFCLVVVGILFYNRPNMKIGTKRVSSDVEQKRLIKRSFPAVDEALRQKYYYNNLKKQPTVEAPLVPLRVIPSEVPETTEIPEYPGDESLVSAEVKNIVSILLDVPEKKEEKVTDETEKTAEKVKFTKVQVNESPETSTDIHSATVDELRPLVQKLGSLPRNSKFIFHNKIPKAGSTTMKWLLVALARRNRFTLDHVRPCIEQETCNEREGGGKHVDGPDGEKAMIEYIPKKMKETKGNYLLLKHHHWFNFTDFGMDMPTYINVARDPVTRYASWYYFERFGWARHEGTRPKFFGDDEDKTRSFDDCVLGSYKECTEPLQVLVRYFCGTDMHACGMMNGEGHDWEKVAMATERAKKIIAQHFYVVGVLEHFSSTLSLFEKMLPDYFTGAVDASKSPELMKQRASSKSTNQGIRNETRHVLETGVLRYEVDIYNLIKSLFYEKLKFYNLPVPV